MNIYAVSGVLLFIAALLYCAHLWRGIMSSEQKSKTLIAASKAYEQHPAGAQMRILVAGDSTAVGVGAQTPNDSVAGRLGQKFPQADIENVSRVGLRLEGLMQFLPTHISATSSYDIILLQIGANDVIGFTTKETVQTELSHALQLASAHAAVVYVLTAGNIGLVPVFKFPLRQLYSFRTRQVREVFMKEATVYTNVTYVDLFKEAPDEPFLRDTEKFYAPDYFHPSGDGYGIWFSELEAAMNRTSSSSPQEAEDILPLQKPWEKI